MTPSRARRLFPLLATGLLALLLAGCGNLPYRIAGNEMMVFGKREMAPYLMQMDDAPMLCGTAEALTPLLMTFESVGTDVDQMAVLVYMGAALCAESVALEQELRYLRALNQGRPDDARDARIAQKRANALAARRQQVSYQRFLAYYGDLPPGQCPSRMKTDIDDLAYLLGMVSGVKAMLNDVQAGGSVGVDKDIAGKILYWVDCLDGDRWWQLPTAMRATVWNFLPGLAPEGAQPMAELARVAEVGAKSGVRLTYAIWALSAYGNGDMENTRRALREFRAAGEAYTLDPRYRVIDAIAIEILGGISDLMWTEATGTRTPPGALGTFWDDAPARAVDVDDLL